MTTLRTILLSLLAFLVLPGCGAINLFPVSEDQRLGAKFDADIAQDRKQYPVYADPTATRYVQAIVDSIIRAPEVRYRGTFPYRVQLLHDDATINAFCTPGGYIYVYTGLLKAIDNEATLAGVLGHEIAHAERRHSTNRMTTQLGVQTLTSIALGSSSGREVELAANAFTGLGLLQNSRNDEEEADEYSFTYLQHTHWYPGGILFFFEKVKGRTGSSLDRFLSTHPLPEDRITQTQARLKSANIAPPTEASLGTRSYADFKRTLK
jgi:predicted Zn-dependent protease